MSEHLNGSGSEDSDSDHVPIGEPEAFWEARKETGAECGILKETEYMRPTRRQSSGGVGKQVAVASR